MIRFREFRNADPPSLAALWRSGQPRRGWMQPMTVEILEQHVLAKPYFDRRGLWVAEGDHGLAGYVHAGFGPRGDRRWIDFTVGVVAMLIVSADHRRSSLGSELLARAEEYLRGQGAERIYGGEAPHAAPYYLGLYGGSGPAGVLDSDPEIQAFFSARGFESRETLGVWQRDLGGFRPPTDRQQLQNRRRFKFRLETGHAPRDWWEACTEGVFESDLATLWLPGRPAQVAAVRVRHVSTMSARWGVRGVGLAELHVEPEFRRQGVATFLLSETLRALGQEGIGLVELQGDAEDAAVAGLCRKLGLARVDQGRVMVRATC